MGADGRYYLYYAFDFLGIIGVAVADSLSGPFNFYGHVRHSDGTLWGRKHGDSFLFDPAVLVDDDHRVYLYSGFYKNIPPLMTGGKKLRCDSGVVLELADDMLTIITPPRSCSSRKKVEDLLAITNFLRQVQSVNSTDCIISSILLGTTMNCAMQRVPRRQADSNFKER